MIPYATFLYFAVAGLYAVIPTLAVSGILPTTPVWVKRTCILLATGLMLAVQYWGPFDTPAAGPMGEIWAVLTYAFCQYLLASALLYVRLAGKQKWAGYSAVALAVAPLAAAKFWSVAPGSHSMMGLVEFVGLSFATLRAVDVLVEIQDGLIKSLPFSEYIAFLVFFPTISSGPVDRYRRFALDWKRPVTRASFWADVDGAVHRIFTGFFYKFVLAHLINEYWLKKIPESPTFLHNASYMYAYSFYLFFDFAGYSAFAIGFSYLFGFHVPENFHLPFLSRNIKEFWTRWHITLSYWFRDFVYMRFLLTAFKKKWFKSRYTAAYVANFITFGLMGFWHGTARYYLIYGLYHACLVTGHDIFARWNQPHPGQPAKVWGDSPLANALAVVVTFHFVCFGFLIFSGRRLF